MIDITRLPALTHMELTEAGITDADIVSKSAEELFELWLKWEGIIGFTHRIIRTLDDLRRADHA